MNPRAQSPDGRSHVRRPQAVRARSGSAVLALVVALGALSLACGAVVDEDAERAQIEADRRELQQRIVDLEAALAAASAAPVPALRDRFVIRQFVREPSAAATADDVAAELCLDLFGRGDLLGGIPPSLTTSCVPVAAPRGVPPAVAIDALVDDPLFTCWSGAVPGRLMPPCWRQHR